jgi:hypothetical protein
VGCTAETENRRDEPGSELLLHIGFPLIAKLDATPRLPVNEENHSERSFYLPGIQVENC